jgi:dTDP-glucose 4,6-dehydratase
MLNPDVVRQISAIPGDLKPAPGPYESLIAVCKDRCYAMDTARIERELGWQPRLTLAIGSRKTIKWYLESLVWVEHASRGSYREWISLQYNPPIPAGAANR